MIIIDNHMIHIQEQQIKVQLIKILSHVIHLNHHQDITIKKDKIILLEIQITMDEHMQVIMEVQHGLQLMIIGQQQRQHQQIIHMYQQHQILIMLIHKQILHFIINIISKNVFFL
jgi:hypothetical protein